LKADFDYIIAGAGCAGLSLIMRLLKDPYFSDKTIALIDRTPKVADDRTWCFWEKNEGFFERQVCMTWPLLRFRSKSWSSLLDIAPYEYKMIRSADFYKNAFDTISVHKNVKVIYDEVLSFSSDTSLGTVKLPGKVLTGRYVFSSIMPDRSLIEKPGDTWFLQHFMGWMIETNQPVFNVEEACFMDFTVSQSRGASFMYMLPLSHQSALVEYTLFTRELLEMQEYEKHLKQYISNIPGLSSYQIFHREFGVIPMTNYRFPIHQDRIVFLGTAGGQTKASSGYTFQFIQRHSERIVQLLREGNEPFVARDLHRKKFDLYDHTLLRVMNENKMGLDDIFASIFRKNDPARVLRFLDNDSNWRDDLGIMCSVPWKVFLPAAIRTFFASL
jgi:lycopene beta-cyclase